MIVSVTRDDLRDEFCMADEAFALSPISARATQPSAEDYDAIREAFMETSRGRWFLGEYAKRNRNADTSMVLDAVARIEQSLAVQKQPPPDNKLADALIALRQAVIEARAAVTQAIDEPSLEENLTRVRNGARIVKEISWRWREIGGDGRICDLLDSQVGAIEGACGQITAIDPLAAVNAAFDVISGRIAAFEGSDGASHPKAEASAPPPSPASSDHRPADDKPADQLPAAARQAVEPAIATDDAEAPISAAAMPAETVAADEAVDATAEMADGTADTMTSDAADAHDEAVLDLIALEMAAPDPADADDFSAAELTDVEVGDIGVAEPLADIEIIARQPEPIEPPPAMHAALPPSLPPSLQQYSLQQPSLEQSSSEPPTPEQPSLGSSLIASGIVRRPRASAADPLAPIRRMSQAEKIALFS
jgi:hypothetical protein